MTSSLESKIFGTQSQAEPSVDTVAVVIAFCAAIAFGISFGGCARRSLDGEPSAKSEPSWSFPDNRPYDRRFGIFVGVNKTPMCEDRFGSLNFAVNDARGIHDTLTNGYGFSKDHVLLLEKERATSSNVKSAFTQWLKSQRPTPADSLFFFFAGHGEMTHDGEGLLITYDADAENLDKSCVSISWLKETIRNLSCNHNAIVLDCCFSGSLFLSDKGKTGETVSGSPKARARGSTSSSVWVSNPESSLAELLRRRCFLGLTAGRLQRVLDGGPNEEHSWFTTAILDILSEQCDSTRPDHSFTFRELQSSVYSRVMDENLGHIPEFGAFAEGSEGDMIFVPTTIRPTIRELSRQRKYVNLLQVAQSYWENGAAELTRHSLDQCDLKARNWEWNYLDRKTRSYDLTIADFQTAPIGLAVSADGRFCASCYGESSSTSIPRIRVVDLASGETVLRIFPDGPEPTSIVFSMDGSQIGTGCSDGAIRIYSKSDGVKIAEVKLKSEPLRCAAFLDSYNLLAVQDREVVIVSLRDSTKSTTFSQHLKRVCDVAVSANGKTIASIDPSALLVWDRDDGKVIRVLNGFFGPRASVALSSGGETAAVSDDAGALRFIDIQQGSQLSVVSSACGDSFSGSLRFLREGEEVVAVSGNNTVIWGLDGTRLDEFRAHDRGVTCLAVSEDGCVVATGGRDCTVRTWNVRSSRSRKVLVHEKGTFLAVGYGRYALCRDQRRIEVRNSRNDCEIGTLESRGRITCICCSRGGHVAAGDAQGRVSIWDVEGHGVLDSEEVRASAVSALAFAQSEKTEMLAVATRDEAVTLIDFSRKPIQRFRYPVNQGGRIGPVLGLALSRDGTYLVAAVGEDPAVELSRIHIWDTKTNEEILWGRYSEREYHSVAFSDGGLLAIGCLGEDNQGRVLLWDVVTKRVVNTLVGHRGKVASICFDGTGNRLFSVGDQVKIWAIGRDASATEALSIQEVGHSVSFDDVSQRVFLGTQKGALTLSGAQDACVQWLHENLAGDAAVSPSGCLIAFGQTNGQIKVFSAAEWKLVRTLSGHQDGVVSMCHTPDGRRLLSVGEDGRVLVHDSTDIYKAKEISEEFSWQADELRKHRWTSVVAHPTGLALGDVEGNLVVCKLPDGRSKVSTRVHPSAIRAISFSPRGDFIATGANDGVVGLYDVKKAAVALLKGHSDAVNSVGWNVDGTILASGSEDGSVRAWAAPGWKQVAVLIGGESPVRRVAFSPVTGHVVSGNKNGQVLFRDLQSGDVIHRITEHRGAIECLVFVPGTKPLMVSGDRDGLRVWDMSLFPPTSGRSGNPPTTERGGQL